MSDNMLENMILENLSDVAAERAVLGGLYNHGEAAYVEVSEFLQPETFTDTSNQAFFKCLEYLFKKGISKIDQSSLMSAASALGYTWLFHQKEELNHIRGIISTTIELDNVGYWAVKIRKLQITRLLKKQLADANKSLNEITGTEPIEQIIGIAENRIFDFSQLVMGYAASTPQSLADGLDEYIDYVADNPCSIIGIPTPWHYYNIAIGGGCRRKTISLLGARTGVGKSVLAVNAGLYVAGKQIPVLYLDTEMTSEDHWPRVMANLCYQRGGRFTITDIETGKFGKTVKGRNQLKDAAKYLKSIPFDYLNISGKPFEETVPIMRRWVHQKVGYDETGRTKPCLIIYDYVKLMSGKDIGASMQEYQALGFLMTSMHNFAVKHDVPILSFIQLNRDGIDRESTDVAAGSDRIVWLATNFSIFKEKTVEEIASDPKGAGNRKIVVLKARHGAKLAYNDYINLTMHGQYGIVIEGETKHNLAAKTKQDNMGLDDNDVVPMKDE